MRMQVIPGLIGLMLLVVGVAPAAPADDKPQAAPAGGEPRALPRHAIARLGQSRAMLSAMPRCVAISPDGKTLAVGLVDGTVSLWDPAVGRPLAQLPGPKGLVLAVAFSPDSRTLATGHSNGEVWQWDVATRKRRSMVKLKLRQVWMLAYSPDGGMLAAGGMGQKENLVIIDPRRNSITRSLVGSQSPIRGRPGTVMGLCFSPDSKVIAAHGIEQYVRFIDPATGKQPREPLKPSSRAYSVQYTPDGKSLIVGLQSGSIEIHDLSSDKHRTLTGHGNYVHSLAVTADGRTLASRSYDNTTIVWDLEKGRQTAQFHHYPRGGMNNNTLALSRDGTRLAVTRRGLTIDLWQLPEGRRVLQKPGHWGPVTEVVLSGDGRRLASSGTDGEVKLWDVAAGDELLTFDAPHHMGATLALTDEWIVAAATDRANGQVVAWDLQGEPIPTKAVGQLVRGLALSPDGKVIATGTSDRAVRLSDVRRGEEIVAPRTLPTFSMALAFSADGRVLAAANHLRVYVLRARDLAPIGHIADSQLKHLGISLALSPVGRLVGFAGADRVGRVFESMTGQSIASFESDEGRSMPRCIRFHPTRRDLVALSGRNGTVDVWSMVTGKRVLTLSGHESEVSSLSFSADGSLLASGSGDSTILIWRLPPLPVLEAMTHDEPRLEALWRDLGSTDGRRGFLAIHELARDADGAVALIGARLPVAAGDDDRITRLIEQLDADSFAAREDAAERLRGMGRLAMDALRNAIETSDSAEVRYRARALLEAMASPRITDERMVRTVRAIEVLETIGTDAAVELLKRYAGGAPTALVTERASAALRRLSPAPDKR